MKYDFLLFLFFLVLCSVPSSGFSSSTIAEQPYKRMLDDTNSFSGVEDNSRYKNLSHITIGLFVPTSPYDKVGSAILQAARLVIDQANRMGGYKGAPFRISHRWAEAPWSAGSGEILKLINEDKAIAIITSLSAESHIAAQIAAKLYVPVISVASSDATLSQARVPWIFRLPPDDQVQAAMLVEICRTRGNCQAGLISTPDQDSRIGANSIVTEFSKQNSSLLFHFQLNTNETEWRDVVERIVALSPEVLFVRGTQQSIVMLTALLQEKKLHLPIYLPWTPGLDIVDLANVYPGEIYTLRPVSSTPIKAFSTSPGSDSYANTSPIFFLAFDGVQMVVTSILTNGPDRTAVRQGLGEMTEYKGVNGEYFFDNGGGNINSPTFLNLNETR